MMIISKDLPAENRLKFVDLNNTEESNDIEDNHFQDLAERSGQSPLKIYKLYSIIEKDKKNTFTAVELSTKMDMSVRSINRLLKNLEESGLARIVSKKATGGKGRPRDVYELKF